MNVNIIRANYRFREEMIGKLIIFHTYFLKYNIKNEVAFKVHVFLK